MVNIAHYQKLTSKKFSLLQKQEERRGKDGEDRIGGHNSLVAKSYLAHAGILYRC